MSGNRLLFLIFLFHSIELIDSLKQMFFLGKETLGCLIEIKSKIIQKFLLEKSEHFEFNKTKELESSLHNITTTDKYLLGYSQLKSLLLNESRIV